MFVSFSSKITVQLYHQPNKGTPIHIHIARRKLRCRTIPISTNRQQQSTNSIHTTWWNTARDNVCICTVHTHNTSTPLQCTCTCKHSIIFTTIIIIIYLTIVRLYKTKMKTVSCQPQNSQDRLIIHPSDNYKSIIIFLHKRHVHVHVGLGEGCQVKNPTHGVKIDTATKHVFWWTYCL